MARNMWTQIGYMVTNGKQSLNVGDLVQYEATGTDYNGNWLLLGANAAGEILIISEKSVMQMELAGYEGYKEGIELLNTACAVYGNGLGATGARSVTNRDIRELAQATQYEVAKELVFGKGKVAEYWLASTCERKEQLNCLGMQYVSGGYLNIHFLSYSDGVSASATAGVRAVVFLSRDIELSKEWALKVKRS